MRITAGVAMVLLVTAAPIGAGDAVFLRFADCREAPEQLKGKLAGALPEWIPYIHVCPVRAPGGLVPISVLTVRIDLVVAAQVPDSWPIRIPKAVVLDAQDRPIGELASSVPYEYPFGTEVTFSLWRNNFPRRIDVRYINAAVSGTYNAKPLVWNMTTRKYE